MKITAEARSDQWNADDFIGGPRVFTIEDVYEGKATQKYDIKLAGEKKVWRPPLTVIRIILAAWGDESDLWKGRQVLLFHDPEVIYGGKKVGGIRIQAMTHIDRPITVTTQKRRGEKQEHLIQPLKAQQQAATPLSPVSDEQIQAAGTVDQLRALWAGADPMQQQAIKARVAEIEGAGA